MLIKAILVSTLVASVSAYGDFLTNPRLKWVDEWKREAAHRRAAAADAGCPMAALAEREEPSLVVRAASSTMTRGSQPSTTDPCFNVYQIPPPVNNVSAAGPDGSPGHGYQAPQTNDVRSPCPALNTLANHGYLPRDGRFINGSTLVSAFAQGWGIDESVISVPIASALQVCTFQSGGSENGASPETCDNFDLNILNTPHEFEHDHSFSRPDYQERTQNGPKNNHIFNGTVFNQTLSVLNNSCYMTVEQANEARLLRESTQFSLDKPGWFTLAVGTQETEVGFIFSVMSEVNQPGGSGKANAAQVRVNWWQYWFMYESFPTPLGWRRPSPLIQNSFIQAISASVLSATYTVTPSPFYTQFLLGPTGTTTQTSAGVTFQPMLPNIYTTDPGPLDKRVAEATPTPAA